MQLTCQNFEAIPAQDEILPISRVTRRHEDRMTPKKGFDEAQGIGSYPFSVFIFSEVHSFLLLLASWGTEN